MKSSPPDTLQSPSPVDKTIPAKQAAVPVEPAAKAQTPVSPQVARRILISLMFPAILMPLVSSMSNIALPIIRDDFQIQADMTAWVATVFTLPFMILMPVYGRLSDGVGKRRLILAGVTIFSTGTAITLVAPGLAWLMVGRAIQGIGAAGMMPLGMAFISAIFSRRERGKALGTWSSVGPTVAFIGPLAAGFLVDRWGWRAAFAPALVVSIVAYVVVRRWVPAGLSNVRPRFLQTFDWTGALLLAGTLTMLLFYLASRPITGVASLRDWRLLLVTFILGSAFFWWEQRQRDPFVSFGIFRNKLFSLGSFCASMRMFTMGGLGFLMPLYLVDVRGLSPAYIGLLAMVNPGAMSLMVRFGGAIADRWGSRWPAIIGLSVQGSTMVIFHLLPDTVSLWVVAGVLAYYGLGAGFVLAALHRAAIGHISDEQMGSAAGLYSMLRFAGAVIGTALAGVILQIFLDQALPALNAYQNTFLFFAGTALVGAGLSFWLKEAKRSYQ
jgi:MFS family permease